MTYRSDVKGSRSYRLPIYYLEVKVSYLKRKHWTPVDTWVVTTIDNLNSIVREDTKTRDRLFQMIYGRGYKSQKAVRIDKIYNRKQVGYTYRSYDELTESQKRTIDEDR